MGSQPSKGKWHGNLDLNGKPNTKDKFIKKVIINERLWHIGGIDTCGKYLATVISKPKTKVRIFNIKNPNKPSFIPNSTIESDNDTSMAIALTRLSNGHYLIALFDYDRNFIFYLSKTTNLEDGFKNTYFKVTQNQIPGIKIKNYQNINFITDFSGELFIAATANTMEASPKIPFGKNYIDLISVKIAFLKKGLPLITMNNIMSKKIICKAKQCNFNAGATIYIPDSNHIWLYGIPHWLSNDGKTIKFSQFAY